MNDLNEALTYDQDLNPRQLLGVSPDGVLVDLPAGAHATEDANRRRFGLSPWFPELVWLKEKFFTLEQRFAIEVLDGGFALSLGRVQGTEVLFFWSYDPAENMNLSCTLLQGDEVGESAVFDRTNPLAVVQAWCWGRRRLDAAMTSWQRQVFAQTAVGYAEGETHATKLKDITGQPLFEGAAKQVRELVRSGFLRTEVRRAAPQGLRVWSNWPL